MKYYSTKNTHKLLSFRDAVLKGLPEDNGLYMPAEIPVLAKGFFQSLDSLDFCSIAKELVMPFTSEDLTASVLEDILRRTLTFDAPLCHIEKQNFSLELFHGPTLAFKDFGARFMARVMSHFVQHENKELNILVATSGDTGSAVASGFHKIPGIRVFILYPKNKVSPIQEKQLTSFGENIHTLCIDGTFDDCQHLVKTAFLDSKLNTAMTLSSANSINISRLLPQMFYYVRAFQQVPQDLRQNIIFSVPSGNFGNLTAGLLAKRMGLPVRLFIAANNRNDVVTKYLNTGKFQPQKSVETVSNAMDVGNPSNFVRMLKLYDDSHNALCQSIHGYSYSDEATCQCIHDVFHRSGYILDPHGAIAYLALEEELCSQAKACGIILETAHPAKFIETVESSIHSKLRLPARLEDTLSHNEKARELPADFHAFKEFLLQQA